MKKILNYEEAKKMLKEGCKLFHHNTTDKSYIYPKKSMWEIAVRKDTFKKLLQEGIIEMKQNDFDIFNFTEMYGLK